MNWGCKHDSGASIEVFIGSSHLLTYRYGNDMPKSYFHPVRLLSGHVLTLDSPFDHLWHHGLYFTWKYINGINFWEENEPAHLSGRMRTAGEAETEVTDAGIGIRQSLDWHYADGTKIMEEKRLIRIASAGRKDGYLIAMDMTFRNVTDETLRLDRTAPEDYPWGGYAGMSYRPVRSMAAPDVRNANGEETVPGTHGREAAWCDFSGPLDGGERLYGGICLFDHPGNPRYPSPFYVFNTGNLQFLQAAFLYDSPFELEPQSTLRLRYGMLVHEGRLGHDELAACCERYKLLTEAGPASAAACDSR